MTGIYYMIRHKDTGEFMPELKRTRGYSHWNPGVVDTLTIFNKQKLLGTPRLFKSSNQARRCVLLWAANPNAKAKQYQRSDGEWDEEFYTKPDGRKREDLEVVIVDIVETGVVK